MVSLSRQQAMDRGMKKAIEVPLGLLNLARGCWPHMETLAHHGNITAISDLQVGHTYLHGVASLAKGL